MLITHLLRMTNQLDLIYTRANVRPIESIYIFFYINLNNHLM